MWRFIARAGETSEVKNYCGYTVSEKLLNPSWFGLCFSRSFIDPFAASAWGENAAGTTATAECWSGPSNPFCVSSRASPLIPCGVVSSPGFSSGIAAKLPLLSWPSPGLDPSFGSLLFCFLAGLGSGWGGPLASLGLWLSFFAQHAGGHKLLLVSVAEVDFPDAGLPSAASSPAAAPSFAPSAAPASPVEGGWEDYGVGLLEFSSSMIYRPLEGFLSLSLASSTLMSSGFVIPFFWSLSSRPKFMSESESSSWIPRAGAVYWIGLRR